MENPIFKSDLFITPESLEELLSHADSTSNPYHVVMITMNYCHSLVEREIELAKHPQYKLVALEPARPIWR